MTIKDLHKYIKEYMETVPKDNFRGKTFAIDSDLLLYKYYAVSAKNILNREKDIISALGDEYVIRQKILTLWLGRLLEDVIKHLERKIKPVIVFDGPPPVEKLETIMERLSIKERNRDDFAATYISVKDMDEFEIDERTEAELRKAALSYYCRLRSEDKEIAMSFFIGLGLPVIKGTEEAEAERICAILCREGVADAVESKDGDVLAHLAPIMIKESGKSADRIRVGDELKEVYKIHRIDKVLEGLGLTQVQFQEVCILSGCDYNIPIKGLSFKSMTNFIKKYGSFQDILENIDSFTNNRRDKILNGIEGLNFERCRELFSFVPSETLIAEGGTDFNYDINQVTMILERYNLSNKLDRYNRFIDNFVDINEVECTI